MSKKQKQNISDGYGDSKYASKVRARRKAAAQLGLSTRTPWPIIWQHPNGMAAYKRSRGEA